MVEPTCELEPARMSAYVGATALVAANNAFGAEGGMELAQAVGKAQFLSKVDLYCNDVGEAAATVAVRVSGILGASLITLERFCELLQK